MTQEPPDSDQNQATTTDDEASQEPPKTEELHYSEKWFHGRLKGGRSAAVALISNYKREDGTFLVRESETFVGDYTLSAWRKGRVIHCHIHSKYEWGRVKYYLVDSLLFDSLYSLISYYREHPIRGLEFHVKLGDPVPQPSMHEGKPWFHKIDRVSAEDYLRRVRLDGTFVVRPSTTSSADDQKFVISFRAKNKIKHCVIKEDGRLFIVGENKFETLADLVQHYHKYPFYQGVCLKWPLTEELMKAEANCDPTDIYSEYLDTNAMKTETEDSNLMARAMYDYSARQDDEISFRKDDVITHVVREFEGWWRGECGGTVGLFPCNRVVIIEDNSILGDLQKGCIELTGARVDLRRVSVTSTNDFPWRIVIEKNGISHSFGVEQEEEGIIWVDAIRGVGEIASERESEHKKMERINRVAKELSSLIIYCCSVNKFSMERIKSKRRCFQEMSSFPETTAEKLFTSDKESFLWYHELQLSRVYPKGQRLDSSNYIPVPFWGVGCQMVALNYQTPDKALQLNQAKFRQNGRCGYIIRPEYQFPSETLAEPVLKNFALTVIGGRHLWKSGRGIISPFAEIEVMGSDHRTLHFNHVHKTRTIPDNGLNPYWNETFPFSVYFPESTMIRVAVYDEDMFGDRNFIGQASYPLHCLKSGFRSMQLLNGFSDEIELATLLVHFFKA